MKKLVLMFGALLLLTAPIASSTCNPTRELVFNVQGVIVPYEGTDLANDADPTKTELHTTVTEMKAAIKMGAKNLIIKLDTPGGYLTKDSEELGQLIRSYSGTDTKISCLVDGTAYSLGAFILTQCDTRLATPGSKVMWHSVAVGLPEGYRLNEASVLELYKHIVVLNAYLWQRALELVPVEYFRPNFEAERLIPVEELVVEVPGFIIIVE